MGCLQLQLVRIAYVYFVVVVEECLLAIFS